MKNPKAITLESIGKVQEMISLAHHKIRTLEELRIALIYNAIERKVVKLDVPRRGNGTRIKIPKGAKITWPNGDEMLLTFDEYKKCVKDSSIAVSSLYEEERMKRNWNK